MRKTGQIILCFLLLLGMTGCSSHQEEKQETQKLYTLHFYFVDMCNLCNEFKEEGIPLIEEELGDIVEIVYHDFDDDTQKEEYDELLSKIDVDQIGIEYYGIAPTLILEGYFIKVGIYYGDYEIFIEDIKKAINGEELSEDLSFGRAPFFDIEVVE